MYIRLEWAVQTNGKVYITETGHDDKSKNFTAGRASGGVLAHHLAEVATQVTADTIEIHDYFGRILSLI